MSMNKDQKPSDIQKKFEQQLKDRLLAVKFPVESIFPDFKVIAQRALLNRSAMGCNCDFESYKTMVERVEPDTISDWDLYNISNPLNVIETAKPADLGLTLPQYLDVITQTRKMAAIWNELVEPIKNQLMDELTPKKPQPKANMKVIPKNHGGRR